MSNPRPAPLTIDQAITRYAVVSEEWRDFGGQASMPYIPAFLAGWNMRAIGAPEPENVGQWRDSFRVGYREASAFADLWNREQDEKSFKNQPHH